jgi:hypothetical protein
MTEAEQAALDAAAAAKTAADAQAAAAGGAETWETYVAAHPETAPLFEARAAVLHRALEKERTNAQDAPKLRKQLEALEKEKADREAEKLSDLEKERKRADDAEAREKAADERAKTTALKAAFENAAYKAGVAHPEDVYLLADKSAVAMDDDGKVTGVVEAVKALVDAGRVPMTDTGPPPAPNLDGGAGGNHGNSGAAKLTADEIEMAGKMGVSLEAAAKQKAAMLKEQAAV